MPTKSTTKTPHYCSNSTAELTAGSADLHGKVVIITGANSGMMG